METDELYCDGCNRETSHVLAGKMPIMFTRDEHSSKWEDVGVCTECGGLTQLPVTNDQVEQAHQEYLQILVDQGIMTEAEIEAEGVEIK